MDDVFINNTLSPTQNKDFLLSWTESLFLYFTLISSWIDLLFYLESLNIYPVEFLLTNGNLFTIKPEEWSLQHFFRIKTMDSWLIMNNSFDMRYGQASTQKKRKLRVVSSFLSIQSPSWRIHKILILLGSHCHIFQLRWIFGISKPTWEVRGNVEEDGYEYWR